jgi:hypothetical protein
VLGDQLVPFQEKVLASIVDLFPPACIAAVCVPKALPSDLTSGKSFTSVQEVPFQDSVFATVASPGFVTPPIPNADVFETPTPDPLPLAVLKSATDVQDVPL